MAVNGFRLLPIDFQHVAAVGSLPFHHRDPFDRLLISQAQGEKLTIVTADAACDKYGVLRFW
jgi:PIN domain nuclease of toxin-antitoxin system